MEHLFSLKGLISIAATLISIKTLQVNLRISRDVNVNGIGNTIIINEALAPMRQGFTLLGRLLVIIFGLTYPVFGFYYNDTLEALAWIGVPLILISFVGTMRGYGLRRIFDLFYVLGGAVACWLAVCADIYLNGTARNATQIYPLINYILQYGFPSLENAATWTSVVTPFLTSCISVMGFAALLLSLLSFLFAHLAARDFDGSLRYLIRYGIAAIVGFFVACDGVTAFVFHDFSYIHRLILSALPG